MMSKAARTFLEQFSDHKYTMTQAQIREYGFHADPSHIALHRWIRTLIKHTTPVEIMVALLYISRASTSINTRILTKYNSHRVILSAIIIANKYLSDFPIRIRMWCRIVPYWSPQQLAGFEREFLELLNYRCHLASYEFTDFVKAANHSLRANALQKLQQDIVLKKTGMNHPMALTSSYSTNPSLSGGDISMTSPLPMATCTTATTSTINMSSSSSSASTVTSTTHANSNAAAGANHHTTTQQQVLHENKRKIMDCEPCLDDDDEDDDLDEGFMMKANRKWFSIFFHRNPRTRKVCGNGPSRLKHGVNGAIKGPYNHPLGNASTAYPPYATAQNNSCSENCGAILQDMLQQDIDMMGANDKGRNTSANNATNGYGYGSGDVHSNSNGNNMGMMCDTTAADVSHLCGHEYLLTCSRVSAFVDVNAQDVWKNTRKPSINPTLNTTSSTTSNGASTATTAPAYTVMMQAC